MQAHLVQASEVKKTIEWIICHLDDHYAADSVAAAIALGAAAAETASESDGQITTFSQFSPPSNFSRGFSIQERGNDAATMSNLSRNFRFIYIHLLLFLDVCATVVLFSEPVVRENQLLVVYLLVENMSFKLWVFIYIYLMDIYIFGHSVIEEFQNWFS